MLTTIFIAAAIAQAYGSPPSSQADPTASVQSASRPAAAAPAATILPPAPVAIPGRGLRDLPNTTVAYYNVAGKNGKAIQKSLATLLADPAAKDTVRLFSWDVGTQIVKATTGTKCSIQSAKPKLTARVNLPRLADQAKVPKDVAARWASYVAGVEAEAAANLWFLSDRLRGAEQVLVGVPCDQASSIWNAKLETVKSELNDFIAKRAQVAVKPVI
jgi:predicted secreted Zn-dependent protease